MLIMFLLVTGVKSTLPSLLKVKRLTPPNAAAYWSCLPIGFFSTLISIWHASSAICAILT